MSRLVRIVIPGIAGVARHVTRRGKSSVRVILGDDECSLTRDLIGESCLEPGVVDWCRATCNSWWCTPMPPGLHP